MGKIKILSDADGGYGYPVGVILPTKELIDDYINCLNEVEDADTISFLKDSKEEIAVDFIADLWGLDYEYV